MHICNFENLDLHFSLHSCAIFMIEPEFESESESEVAVPKNPSRGTKSAVIDGKLHTGISKLK